jgi:hypothetical protein
VKAVYALRCFYGESLESGEDLKVELRRLALAERLVVAAFLLALVVLSPGPARAALATPPTASAPPSPASLASVSAPELDRAIGEVIQQNKYAWRMPREKLRSSETEEPGIIRRFFQRVREFLRSKIRAFFDWLKEWLRKLFRHRRQESVSDYSWIMMLEVLLYALLAAVVAGLALLLYRVWRNPKLQKATIASQPIASVPDLADESLGAEQLPEDRWTALGRELLESGDLRLAARAFYFASLASLAGRNLISLAKFKSNRDYEQELRRRGHSFPELLGIFSENVGVIDRIWYGLHQINAELVSRFAANVERIKTAA